MVIALHRLSISKAAALIARSLFWLFALFSSLTLLVIPATAWGDIYKWTDETGGTSISNVPPPTSGNAKDIEVVLKEPKLTPSEQALLARIDALERQVSTPQQPAPAVPPPIPYPSFYPPAPQPPPPSPSYYDSGYAAGYDNSYYPSYYPIYSYPVARSYSYAAYPARAYANRSAFAPSHGGFSHSSGGHGGGRGGRR